MTWLRVRSDKHLLLYGCFLNFLIILIWFAYGVSPELRVSSAALLAGIGVGVLLGATLVVCRRLQKDRWNKCFHGEFSREPLFHLGAFLIAVFVEPVLIPGMLFAIVSERNELLAWILVVTVPVLLTFCNDRKNYLYMLVQVGEMIVLTLLYGYVDRALVPVVVAKFFMEVSKLLGSCGKNIKGLHLPRGFSGYCEPV